MAFSSKSLDRDVRENNYNNDFLNMGFSSQDFRQSSLSFNESTLANIKPKRVTFINVNLDSERGAFSSKAPKSNLNVEKKQSGILLNKYHSYESICNAKSNQEAEKVLATPRDVSMPKMKNSTPRPQRKLPVSNHKRILEKFNENRENSLKNAIEDKRFTRKLLQKAKTEIKHFKFYQPNAESISSDKLETNKDLNESKLKEHRYGRGRFGIMELMEESIMKQNELSPREIEDEELEHYIIERITTVNIESRKLVFKKQR